ncbi:MAG: DUF3098 domain-containing protein [Marinifilaceae bacterium]|nr:DUF3098 domain-containing protein [Marinifilaceae bacterium]
MASIIQTKKEQQEQKKRDLFPLQSGSYKFILIGFAIVVLGFVLMMGGGAESADTFNYEIFSFRRITLAPIVVLAGFAVVAWAIIRRSKSKK